MAAWLNLHFLFQKEKRKNEQRGKNLARVLKSLWSGTLLKPRSLHPARHESHHLSVLTDSHPNISLNVILFNRTCVLFRRLASNMEGDIKLMSIRQNRKKTDKLLPYH